MSLTRKHFRALASIVADTPAQGCSPDWLAYELANFCQTQNPNFDLRTFLAACKVPREESHT